MLKHVAGSIDLVLQVSINAGSEYYNYKGGPIPLI